MLSKRDQLSICNVLPALQSIVDEPLCELQIDKRYESGDPSASVSVQSVAVCIHLHLYALVV